MMDTADESIVREIREQMAALGCPVDAFSDEEIVDNMAWFGAALASLSVSSGEAAKAIGEHAMEQAPESEEKEDK